MRLYQVEKEVYDRQKQAGSGVRYAYIQPWLHHVVYHRLALPVFGDGRCIATWKSGAVRLRCDDSTTSRDGVLRTAAETS